MISAPTNELPPERDQSLRHLAMLVYVLQILVVFSVYVTFIAGLIINYLKRDDVTGSWLESHFRWQIRTFWFALPWAVIGALTWFVYIGQVILFITAIWILYRVIKGWMYLHEHRPLPVT